MKIKKVVATGLIVIGSLGMLAGCGEEEVSTTVSTTAVEVEVIGYEDLYNTITLSGYLRGENEVSLVATAVNTVESVKVAIGDTVKAGDVLVVIDSTSLQVQLDQAVASYNMSKTNYDDAVTNLARMEILYAEGAISLSTLEQAQSSVALSSLDSVEANIKLIQEQIDACTITSPIDGVVASLNATVGEIITQSGYVAVISDMSVMKLETTISEANVGKVAVGDSVDVVVSSISSEAITGTVTSIAPAADLTSMSFPITITVDNADGSILSGMFSEVTIKTDVLDNVLAVKKADLVSTVDPSVYVIDEDNIATKVYLEVGLETSTYWEVISGISEGDVVVSVGQHLLYDGALVNIVN